jgi:hypothetical protein
MTEPSAAGVTKIVSIWLLVIAVYTLLYMGANEGLWPMIAHYRHTDWQVPVVVEALSNLRCSLSWSVVW